MRRLLFIIGFSLILIKGYSQSDTSTAEYDYWNYGITFKLQVGIWVPLGNLSGTLSPSPSVGLLFGLPIAKKISIDAGMNIFIPINANRFDYHLPDTILSAKPSLVCGVMGIWITHTDKISSKYFIDKSLGIGLGFIQTDKNIDNPESDNHTNHSIETMNFSLGINLRKIIFRKRSFGLNITYNFTPYSLFQNHVEKKFGSQSLATGVMYKF